MIVAARGYPSAVPDSRLQIDVDFDTVPAVVRLLGEIDVDTAAQVGGVLTAAAEAGHDLVLDMSGVEFMDSAGLNLLLSLRKQGRFTLRGLSERALRLFQLTGLYEVFDIDAAGAEPSARSGR